jgi:hypothetical protein
MGNIIMGISWNVIYHQPEGLSKKVAFTHMNHMNESLKTNSFYREVFTQKSF